MIKEAWIISIPRNNSKKICNDVKWIINESPRFYEVASFYAALGMVQYLKWFIDSILSKEIWIINILLEINSNVIFRFM